MKVKQISANCPLRGCDGKKNTEKSRLSRHTSIFACPGAAILFKKKSSKKEKCALNIKCGSNGNTKNAYQKHSQLARCPIFRQLIESLPFSGVIHSECIQFKSTVHQNLNNRHHRLLISTFPKRRPRLHSVRGSKRKQW